MPMPLAELHNSEADHAALLALFKEMEFKTWVDESTALLNSAPSFELTVSSSEIPNEQIQPVVADMQPQASVEKDYQIILTEAELVQWVEKIKTATLVAVDTETTSLDYMRAELVGISVAVKAHEALIFLSAMTIWARQSSCPKSEYLKRSNLI